MLSCGIVGGAALFRIFVMSINVFVVSLPYFSVNIFCGGACKMSMILAAACCKYVSGIVIEKGTYCGKNSTVSTILVPHVSDM